ncbi:acyltransferase family protein [Halomonas alimentaria]|uniref:acyltransferase family protein n=1 Tax=Halomonas alimentaria TaxID=147248 RepID=UPI0024933332|nr:acyltransferase family protein [Halomonas alimentaria]
MQKSKYRPDIDGLRALAVISVVIFHFNNGWFPGGFVGVDVFFVISGFLITGIVYKEVSEGEFSFKNFFVRRVKRILPAALFVTLVTLVVGVAFMLPDDAAALSESAFASTLSLANVYFWLFLDKGYFATSTDTVPLLHMWSLGVEEQFYLIWPALLLILYRFGGTRFLVFSAVLLCGLSFMVSRHYVSVDPDFAYYMLPARAGELLVGCMTYFLTKDIKATSSRIPSQILSVAGGLMLIWSFAFIDKKSGFPGLIALVPTIGAALLIASGSIGKSMIGTILSFKPLVWIGLLSFSLYLWHWPVLAFYRYAYGEPTLVGGLVCLFLILALTIFSYRYVELPFRYGGVGRLKSPVLAALGAVVVIGFSGFVYSKDGYVSQGGEYSKKLNEMEEVTKAAFSFPYVCQTGHFSETLLTKDRCVIGPKDQVPSVLIWGDSNAAHYVGYLKVIAEELGVTMRNANHGSCVPFFNNASEFVAPKREESCSKFNQAIKGEFEKYNTVVIGASWTSYASRSDLFEKELRETIGIVSDRVESVIIAKKIPIFRGYDRLCAQKSISIPFMGCRERSEMVDNGDHAVNELIEQVAGQYENVTTISIRDHICDGSSCRAYLNDMPIYFDSGHLSLLGSEALGGKEINENSIPEVLTNLAGGKG